MGNLAQLSDIFKQSLTSKIEIKTTFIEAEYFSNEIKFKVTGGLMLTEKYFCSDCPEVSAELGVVHSGPGHSASLSCIVSSDPPANVRSADLSVDLSKYLTSS